MTKSQRKKLDEAIVLLTEYLIDNTEEVFEDIPEIDEARCLLFEIEEEAVKGDTWHTRKYPTKVTAKE